MLLLLVGILMTAGCRNQTQPSQPAASSDGGSGSTSTAQSSVPLRVWFVGEEESRALIERQWQASSDRSLALRMLSSDQLLAASQCECDVVIYPAHLLGDLVSRQWLVELPGTLVPATPSSASASTDSASSGGQAASAAAGRGANAPGGEVEETLQPAGWVEQTRYGKSLWGLSLGATAPVVLSNFSLDVPSAEGDASQSPPEAKAYWQSAIEALSVKTSSKRNDHAPLADADPDAVCDRFLLVLSGINRRESRFGSLLDLETLEPRLSEPEFVDAAGILLELHRLNSAPEALAGSYRAAWEALGGDQPCVSIGVPPLPEAEVDKVTEIESRLPPNSPGLGSARSAASERITGWNSGHGLVCSLTSQCRQTGRAIELLRWLASEPNRAALARRVEGMSAPGMYAPGSSAWQAQRLGERIIQQPRLPKEPRLPGSALYRRALGQQLVLMLNGQQDPQATLGAAAATWNEITVSRDRDQLKASYEASLGL